MVFSHTLHSLEHGDRDLFGLVAFGQGSLHLCPPVMIGNAVISVRLPEQRENQLLALCQTTLTKITFRMAWVLLRLRLAGWDCPEQPIASVYSSLLSKSAWLVRSSSGSSTSGELYWPASGVTWALSFRGVPGRGSLSCRFMLQRVSWMKYWLARQVIPQPLAGSGKVCQAWGDSIGEGVGEACILASLSLVLSCMYCLALATSYRPSLTILWRALTSTAEPTQGWMPFNCWQCVLESS